MLATDGLPFKDYSMMVTGDVGIDIVFNELKTNGTSVKIFGNFHISFLICLGFFFLFVLLLLILL